MSALSEDRRCHEKYKVGCGFAFLFSGDIIITYEAVFSCLILLYQNLCHYYFLNIVALKLVITMGEATSAKSKLNQQC